FKPLLEALHLLRSQAQSGPMSIRTALVTARSAPAHERAVRTLMDWGIEDDEAMFLGGLGKGPFLREFEPDFFFDDQTGHCEQAAAVEPTGQVAVGIANDPPDCSGDGRAAFVRPGVKAHHRPLEVTADQVAYGGQGALDGVLDLLLLFARWRVQHVVDDLLLEAEFARMVDAHSESPEFRRTELGL